MARLGEIAAAQWGLVTSRQAIDAGVRYAELDRLCRDGALDRMAFGVYRVGGAPRVDLLELCVAWLQLEPGVEAEMRGVASGVVSHTSAARVYGVGDFEPDRYEFTTPVRRRTRRHDVKIHTARVDDAEMEWIDQLPVTRPPRILADLLADRQDGDHLAQVIVDTLDRGLASEEELSAAAAPYAAAYGLSGASGMEFIDHLVRRVSPDGGGERLWMSQRGAPPRVSCRTRRRVRSRPR